MFNDVYISNPIKFLKNNKLHNMVHFLLDFRRKERNKF